MKKIFAAFLALLLTYAPTMAKTRFVNFRIIETSDVHGSFYPYDFINRQPKKGSLSRVFSYVEGLRKSYGDKLILLDNGDILQGQPTCYYCNFINTSSPNVAAEILNYMNYDACTIGNHDIETGHPVYDRWASEVKCPVLGANVIDTKKGKPYFKPYTIIERDGIKIAVLGMITPAIPHWLNNNLWSGMRFEEMVESARHWIDFIKKNERPQLIIGLFHSGREGGIKTAEYQEDASIKVAQEVPGFDIVLYGHDHTRHAEMIINSNKDSVLCMDPSCDGYFVSDAQIELKLSDNKIIGKKITGKLYDISNEYVSEKFMQKFKYNYDSVNAFVSKRIGYFENTIRTRDAYFGPSAFIDFIHDLQMKITGASISFCAPLTFDTQIKKGDVYISDMFNLYRYENQIYVMKLSGKEIRDFLEMSYDLWVNTMHSPNDHIMLMSGTADDKQRNGFKNLAFNFDSAAGINYTVDVTKPDGKKVEILSLADGKPFSKDSIYNVAMNSYRGNGGGELLTKGAGIPHDSLSSRIIYASERDQRYYLMKYIEKEGRLNPHANNNWRFIPEAWTKQAIERDRKLIFGNDE